MGKSLIFYRLLSLKDEFEYISNKNTVKINRNIFVDLKFCVLFSLFSSLLHDHSVDLIAKWFGFA
jgi:hypothetical protein